MRRSKNPFLESNDTYVSIFKNKDVYFNMTDKELDQTIEKCIAEIEKQRLILKEVRHSKKTIKKLAEKFPSHNQRQLALRVLNTYPQLHTPRQVQIVVYGLLGMNTKDVAVMDNLSIQAVKFIKTRILKLTKKKTMNEMIAEIVQKEINAN